LERPLGLRSNPPKDYPKGGTGAASLAYAGSTLFLSYKNKDKNGVAALPLSFFIFILYK